MSQQSEKRPRSTNWVENEKIVLTEAVLAREATLFGKLKGVGGFGVGISSRDKIESWQEVVSCVNAVSVQPRTADQCKKQFDNIKQRAKEKIDGLKKPKTGGGPKLPDPTPCQQLVIDGMGDRPQMTGIQLGLDTMDEDMPAVLGFHDSNASANEDTCAENIVKKNSRKRQRSPDYRMLEKENLTKENQKLDKQLEKLDKEIIKINGEIELLNVQKIYYMAKIQKEFGFNFDNITAL